MQGILYYNSSKSFIKTLHSFFPFYSIYAVFHSLILSIDWKHFIAKVCIVNYCACPLNMKAVQNCFQWVKHDISTKASSKASNKFWKICIQHVLHGSGALSWKVVGIIPFQNKQDKLLDDGTDDIVKNSMQSSGKSEDHQRKEALAMGYSQAYNSANSFFDTVQDTRIVSNDFTLQAQRRSYNLY